MTHRDVKVAASTLTLTALVALFFGLDPTTHWLGVVVNVAMLLVGSGALIAVYALKNPP